MASSHEGKVLQHTRHGLRMVGEKKSLFDLNEPVWHPDEKSVVCDSCKDKFTFTNRRHHCRRCGDVICGSCSVKQPLHRMGFIDPVLVCKVCGQICHQEDEFYKTHLKILENGAYFELSDTNTVYNCKLSSDHFQILINGRPNPFMMSSILEIKSLSDHSNESPSPGGKLTGLRITYRENDEEKVIVFTPSKSHSRKQSTDWLKALKKGLMIVHSKEKRTLSLSDSLS